MNSENKLIIHSNENDKEINHYGKLLLAYKDYQLMEAIKLLPDDMIKEIKQYVMNPYKFMPELKLYKFPVFYCDNNNTLIKNNRRYETSVRTRSGSRLKMLYVRKLNKGWGREIDHVNISKKMINDLYLLKYHHYKLPKYKVVQILKDLNIKGRTQLIKFYDKSKMGSNLLIHAVIRGS